MKKWLFILIFTKPLMALYMGNPASPGMIEEGFFFCKENWFAVKGGYQRDWVFDRNMKAVSKISGRLDDFKCLADQGALVINLINRIEVYGSAGAAHFFASNRPSGSGVKQEYQTYNQLTWGFGIRGEVYAWNQLSFGVSGKCQIARPNIKWMTTNGALVNPRDGSRVSFYEWQIGTGVSYQIDMLIPYLGVKYSNAGAHFKHLPSGFLPSGHHFKVKNRRKFGMVIGTSFSTGNRFAATVETRFIDEQSITLAAEVRL
ncbi:MAG: hypothetical protein KDK76_05625 [Chlamydiia bacterium]|nr:hypothetical protein [Chlamydiia bacterium]